MEPRHSLEEKLVAVQVETKIKEDAINRIKTHLRKMEGSISDLKVQIEKKHLELRKCCDASVGGADELRSSKLAGLTEKAEVLRESLQNIRIRKSRLEKELALQVKKNAIDSRELRSAKDTLRRKTDDVSQAAQKVRALEAELRSVQQQAKQCCEERDHLTHTLHRLQSKIASVAEMNTGLWKSRKSLESATFQRIEEEALRQDQIDKLRNENAALMQIILQHQDLLASEDAQTSNAECVEGEEKQIDSVVAVHPLHETLMQAFDAAVRRAEVVARSCI
jgi:chromosome segregation ATPase